MAVAWLLTLPSAAIVGALSAWVAGRGTFDTVLVALIALTTAAGIYALSRRKPITAENVNDVPAAQPAFASA
jgi:PiT family inorganic phosphate transporter